MLSHNNNIVRLHYNTRHLKGRIHVSTYLIMLIRYVGAENRKQKNSITFSGIDTAECRVLHGRPRLFFPETEVAPRGRVSSWCAAVTLAAVADPAANISSPRAVAHPLLYVYIKYYGGCGSPVL